MYRSRCTPIALAFLMIATPVGPSPAEMDDKRLEKRIASLIEKLGDPKFSTREAASHELFALGERALRSVQKAAAEQPDPEVRQRCKQVETRIMLSVRVSKSTQLGMVIVRPGTFTMGSPGSEKERRPDEQQHKVTISRPFLLGQYEVSQEQYQQVMGRNPSYFSRTGKGKAKVSRDVTSKFPVEQVSWYDAIEFCNRLSKKDGYPPYYELTAVEREDNAIFRARVAVLGGRGYRLPTEAEWEYACRAGTTSKYHYGTRSGGRANLKYMGSTGYGSRPTLRSLGKTVRIGTYKPNAWGLYEMHGNVGEWCWDWYSKDAYPKTARADPKGPKDGVHRTMRGGSWLVNEENGRSASRFWLVPGERKYFAGFRVARTP